MASECTEDGYAEYKPVFINNLAKSKKELYVVDELRVGIQHSENIKFVFDFYKIEYKVVDNKIMMVCEVWKDKDYMANMTKKAEDKDWLTEHGEK